mmetsp:Transcript_34558/g.50630  ORF Transcript_34558/g.50630 Transcript_34558/m.50630 type:complete len:221 (+) Transcript_34558:179-841(+)
MTTSATAALAAAARIASVFFLGCTVGTAKTTGASVCCFLRRLITFCARTELWRDSLVTLELAMATSAVVETKSPFRFRTASTETVAAATAAGDSRLRGRRAPKGALFGMKALHCTGDSSTDAHSTAVAADRIRRRRCCDARMKGPQAASSALCLVCWAHSGASDALSCVICKSITSSSCRRCSLRSTINIVDDSLILSIIGRVRQLLSLCMQSERNKEFC